MNNKTKTLVALLVLCIVDAVIPIPILGAILVIVVLQKPPWFLELVKETYQSR